MVEKISLVILTTTLFLKTIHGAVSSQACNTELIKTGVIKNNDVKGSSRKPGSSAIADGWCFDKNQKDQKYIDITLATPKGIKGVVLYPASTKLAAAKDSYAKAVLFQYVPRGQSSLVDYRTQNGSLVIKGNSQTNFATSFTGVVVEKIRLTLNESNADPCFTFEVLGCAPDALCPSGCEHGGVCFQEEYCQCTGAYQGPRCDIARCIPRKINVTENMLAVSSQETGHEKDNSRPDCCADNGKLKGWCASSSDRHPWFQITLDKPMAISELSFNGPDIKPGENLKMTKTFDLQYIAPSDSSKLYRTYAGDIQSYNGTHVFNVQPVTPMITDTVRIVPKTWIERACFTLVVSGCDPKALCADGWCLHGGSCMGENTCLCPSGFVGDRCQSTTGSVRTNSFSFVRKEINVIITTAFNFVITGNIEIKTEQNTKVVYITGQNSFIALNNSHSTDQCLVDVDACKSGFTYSIEVNFIKPTQVVYILSSGGDLSDGKGLALYYKNNQLHYTVSTNRYIWTVSINYNININVWHHFEITWSKILGLGLFLDGKLIGTVSQPTPRSFPAKKSYDLCIGCSHTSKTTDVQMKVKELKSWSLDRTELVKAKILKAAEPASTVIPATTKVTIPPTTPATTAITTAAKPPTTVIPVTTKVTIPPATPATTGITTAPTKGSYQSYNMTFVNIVNNILITPAFNFTLHGNPVLRLEPNGQTALVLNGSNQFIELVDKGIPCLEDLRNCQNGFTFMLEVQFLELLPSEKIYIISSGGDLANSSGMSLYVQYNKLVAAVKLNKKHWYGQVDYTFNLKVWYRIEMSWNAVLGTTVRIDGKTLIENVRVILVPGIDQTHPVYIGNSFTTSTYTAHMKVRNFFTWTAHRQILVDNGIIKDVTTPKVSATTSTSTTTATTTLEPITEYKWNFSNIHTNTIAGNQYTLIAHGNLSSNNEGGVNFHSSNQFIDFNTKIKCLNNILFCTQGITVQFTIKFSKLEENTYLLSSGGENPMGTGIAILYRFGRIQFIFSTDVQSWYVSYARKYIVDGHYHTIQITWFHMTGLTVYVDNTYIDSTNVAVNHSNYINQNQSVYFGKPSSSVVTTTSTTVNYVLKAFTVWYSRLEVLVQRGICKPPHKPPHGKKTTTPFPSTTKPTTAKKTTHPSTPAPKTTKRTARPTTIYSTYSTTVNQCPAGCVPIGSTPKTSKPTVSTKKTTVTTKPTTKRPKPSATTKRSTITTEPTTTRRALPPYTGRPTIAPIVEKDGSAYLSCTFPPANQPGVELLVSFLIDGKVMFTEKASGKTGRLLYSVAQINDNMHNRKLQCSVSARYVGSTLQTKTVLSNNFIPTFKVTPGKIIVIEGKGTHHVVVTSTAPPPFFCCKGCRGRCQVHIVANAKYDRHDYKCRPHVKSQALVLSTKPATSRNPVCGAAMTQTTLNEEIRIPIKARIDGAIDRDHTREFHVEAYVYSHPPTATITAKPIAISIGKVAVVAKDNDHRPSTCGSVNDPHMSTFDGLRYDNMNEGEFVLYKHSTLPFEVRAQYKKCSSRSHATCNCAVAVMSGDDVITLDGCGSFIRSHHHHHHGSTPLMVQIYKNDGFTPGTSVRRFGCGQKYEIELPTGMIITVQKSYRSFINIWIKASSPDRGETRGLCGRFDGDRRNDLTDRNGHVHRIEKKPYSFCSSWKESSTIFYGVGKSSQSLWGNYCSCVNGYEQLCQYGLGVITCSKSRYDITDALLRQARPPSLRRSKRQAPNTDSPTPSLPTTNDTNITDVNARTFCTETIENNTATQTCADNNLTRTNLTDYIDNCVTDYMATGDKTWARDTLRDLIHECVTEANAQAASSPAANETGVQSVNVTEIMDKTCLEDCGEHGKCTNAICQCEAGFSGVDCKVSKDTKPTVFALPADGQACDVSETADCKMASIFGDNFVESPNITCHYAYITVEKFVKQSNFRSTVPAVFMGINQVLCPLPELRSAYIRISNNGINVSDVAYIHVVYHSTCYSCSLLSDANKSHCERKSGTCVINGECYSAETEKPDDNCKLCKPSNNDAEWTDSAAESCISKPLENKGDDSDVEKKQVIILAVVCAVLGALVVVGIIYICRTRGNKKKTEFGHYDVSRIHRDYEPAEKSKTYDNPTYTSEKL